MNFKIGRLLIATIISILFFEIYLHYWVADLFGTDVVMKSNIIFITLLIFISAIYNLNTSGLHLRKGRINNIILILCLFFIFGFVSLMINEPKFHTYFYYLFSPIILFFGILGIYKYNEMIQTTLKFLFLLGLVFSVYGNYLFSADALLDTNQNQIGNIVYYTGGVFGSYSRLTIPGISSIAFGSMLLLLVMVGIFYVKHTDGRRKWFYAAATLFLAYTLFATGSRAAFVSLIGGTLYFIVKGWLSRREMLVGLLVFSALLLSTRVLIFRFLASIAPYFGGLQDIMFMGDPIPLITLRIEPRIWTFASTISLFLSSPIFGVGFTNFIETQGVVVEGVPEAPPPSIEHNHVLAMFAQAGLATAFPYVLSVIALFILLNRTVKRAVEIDEGNKELGILLGGGTISCFIDMNFAARNYTYYWIWFALAASWIRNYGNK